MKSDRPKVAAGSWPGSGLLERVLAAARALRPNRRPADTWAQAEGWSVPGLDTPASICCANSPRTARATPSQQLLGPTQRFQWPNCLCSMAMCPCSGLPTSKPCFEQATAANGAAVHPAHGAPRRPPRAYGRGSRRRWALSAIVEHRDCNESQRTIDLDQRRIYCFNWSRFGGGTSILRPNNAQGEVYLTDTLPCSIQRAPGGGRSARDRRHSTTGFSWPV